MNQLQLDLKKGTFIILYSLAYVIDVNFRLYRVKSADKQVNHFINMLWKDKWSLRNLACPRLCTPGRLAKVNITLGWAIALLPCVFTCHLPLGHPKVLILCIHDFKTLDLTLTHFKTHGVVFTFIICSTALHWPLTLSLLSGERDGTRLSYFLKYMR